MSQSREKFGFFDVRVWTLGSGKPVLYLHGFEQHPGPASFLERLADGRELKAPEHPGYGQSTGLEHAKDVIDVALFYRRLIDNWGKGPVDIVGHSLGGMFAAEVAALSPSSVGKLVLINPLGIWLDDQPTPDPFTLLPDAFNKAKWHDVANAAKEPSAFEAGGTDNAATFRQINMGAATKFLWPLPDRGIRRRLPYITAPTLILHGESDQLVPPAYATAWGEAIRDAKVVGIPSAGHLPMVEAEEATLKAINAFLN